MLSVRVANAGLKIRLPFLYRGLVVLGSSQFQHIIADEGRTSWAYAGDPLDEISFSKRGLMLEQLARRMLERMHPNCPSQDADSQPLGVRVDGRKRHVRHAQWDWVFKGRRVELKTAQLSFDASAMTWRVTFLGVRLADGQNARQPFDDLYLLLYAPNGFYLIKHDLQTGVSKDGVRTSCSGHMIRIFGRRRQTWKEARDTILGRLTLEGRCDLVLYVPKSDPLAEALYTQLSRIRTSDPAQQVYEGIPLNTMNPILRAHRIQQIAFELDQMQNPDSRFRSAAGELTSQGRRRGNGNAAVDWVRDGIRVEVKSSTLRFNGKAWTCTFSHIKAGATPDGRNAYFDELWVAIYSPYALDFFKHPGWHPKLQSIGTKSSVLGKQLSVSGGVQNQCVFTALERIKAQLQEDGAEPQFSVRWAPEGSQ